MVLKWLSRGGYAGAVLALSALYFRESLLAQGIAALSVQMLAVLLMIWARVTFGRRSFHLTADATEGGLITSGPYRFIRHPIYASIIYFLWAGIISNFTLTDTAVGIFATIALMIRIYAEETLIIERYPEYPEYAGRTKRIIPFIF